MSFDRIAWMDHAFKVANDQPDTASFKDRITILALLADDEGVVKTSAYEKATSANPGALRPLWGDVIRLSTPGSSD
jgi:hypothetical protein